jgi:hypothetical protein
VVARPYEQSDTESNSKLHERPKGRIKDALAHRGFVTALLTPL